MFDIIAPMEAADFVEWQETERERRSWSYADLARASGISSAQISRVTSRQQKPGREYLRGVAKAYKLPEAQVFRIAGEIDTPPDHTPGAERLSSLFPDLTDDDIDELYAIALAKLERRKRVKSTPHQI